MKLLGNLFGKSQTELQGQLDEAYETLELAEGAIEMLENSIKGQVAAIGILEKRNDDNFRNGMVTQACLLSAAGGSVTLSKDIIEAIEASDISINHEPVDGGTKMTLKIGAADEAAE